MSEPTSPAASGDGAVTAVQAAATTRLLSLDALRGFDMFWIVGAEDIVHALRKASDTGVTRLLANQMDHKPWAGFAFYDLIFPLFVFMVGISLVFSLGRILERDGRRAALGRVCRRAALLYVIGIFYYGGFATPIDHIRLMGVLQRIALCYLFAGFIFCVFDLRTRIGLCVGLLLTYWALMCFVPVPGIGAGDFAEGHNLANWIDKEYLPWRKWDGDHDPEGLLSTLPAVATCLLGVFAGMLLQNRSLAEARKALYLAGAGVALAAVGWLWHLQFPVIKKVWTSSYVLVAGGYSCLFLAAFHQVIEVWGWRRWAQPFVWIGMNPITIYLVHNLVDLKKIALRFVGGDLGVCLGRGADLAVTIVVMAISFWICRFLYRRKIFLRL
jgi:predicted acyltransferase